MHRIFTTSVASVHPHYVAKLERKGRTRAELHEVIEWLTGFDEEQLTQHLEAGTTFEDFFDAADLNPRVDLITGSVCGVRVQEVEDPLMRKIRYLDKLVDELAKGKSMDKVLPVARRTTAGSLRWSRSVARSSLLTFLAELVTGDQVRSASALGACGCAALVFSHGNDEKSRCVRSGQDGVRRGAQAAEPRRRIKRAVQQVKDRRNQGRTPPR